MCLWFSKTKQFKFFYSVISWRKTALPKWVCYWDGTHSFAEEKSHIPVVYVENPFLTPALREDTVSYTQAKSLSPAQNAVCSLPVWTTWSLIWKSIARRSSFRKPALPRAPTQIQKKWETFCSCSSINLPPLEGRKFNCWSQMQCIT